MLSVPAISRSLAITFLLVLAFTFPVVHAATYYVDYAGGNNNSNGTSPSTPWKHCPGDAAATGTAKSTILAQGDKVIFKGGVSYSGLISLLSSGTDANPIVYDGNSAGNFGTGKAIIDGAVTFNATWTRATSASDVRGNSNWQNIWYCTPPTQMTHPMQLLFYNGIPCYTAQGPNPPNRYYLDDLDNIYSSSAGNMTSTSLRNTSVFTSASSTYYNDAWVGLWLTGNSWAWKPITGFDPATDTISFAAGGNAPYTDRTSYFTIMSNPADIDQPLEYAFCPSQNRLYFWSPNGVSPATLTMSVALYRRAFEGNNIANVTINGFVIRGQWSNAGGSGTAVRVAANVLGSTLTRNIKVTDCDVRYIRSLDREWMIAADGSGGHVFSGNNIEYCYGGALKSASGSNVTFADNNINWINRTSIYFAGISNSRITRNTIHNVRGIHSNGISTYSGCNNIEVSYNDIFNVLTPITYEYSSNLSFVGNLIDGNNEDQHVSEWGGCSGSIVWLNNTLVNSTTAILQIGNGGTDTSYTIRNNIIDGGGPGAEIPNVTRSNNVYLSRAWWQATKYAWNLLNNEYDVTDLNSIFVDPANRNWRLRAGGIPVDAGADVSSAGITHDLALSPRPINGKFDIGAYELGGSVQPPNAPSALSAAP